jgi:hypothetical protein
MFDDNNDDMQVIYDDYIKFTFELINKGIDPLKCAGIMMTHAMMLYKTTLPEDEYHKMIELIANSKDSVKEIKRPQVH